MSHQIQLAHSIVPLYEQTRGETLRQDNQLRPVYQRQIKIGI
ncbi:hypothetical protein [Proteus faecis]|nr:hypothetical protein [Proteus faecis]